MFILHLNADQSAEWIEINAHGDVTASHAITSLLECPKINADDVLVMALPGERVWLSNVVLPKMRAQERVRVAAFALEEQLACDPESIYLVLGESDKAGNTLAAVLDQQYFSEQSAAWQAAQLNPRMAVPDFLAIAYEPDAWTIVLHHGMAIVRTGVHAGFSADPDNLVFLLEQKIAKNPAEKPQKIILWQEDQILALEKLSALGIAIETRDATYKNKWDAAGLLSQFNLLQGKYRPKTQVTHLQRSWKFCGLTALTCVLFLMVSHVVEWIYLRHEARQLQNNVASIYHQLFPGSTAILEPRFRTEALLKRLDVASHGSEFLTFSRVMGEALVQYPGIHLMSMHFENHMLQLSVVAQNAALLTQWIAILKMRGVQVKNTVNKTDVNGVDATVIIS
jgi:general secretion pathway protein L